MNLNLLTPINQLGYGIVGLNVLLALHDAGHKVSFFPIGQVEAPPHLHDTLSECFDNSKLFDCFAPCLKIWHQHDMASRIGSGHFAGMPIFELNKFSEQEIHHLASLDKVIVNSQWAAEIVDREVDVHSVVVPLGVDTNIFKPKRHESKSTTVFLNMGKWEIRKGHDILVDIFNRAFSSDDDVELWLCCHNPFYSAEENEGWARFYKESPLGDKIKIIPRLQSQSEVADLMSKADCGVFPTRGEGWNLEALEMMACGKHVITTNYSGHTEFCNDDNSILIDIDGMEDAVDGKWFHGQGQWAKLGEDAIDGFAFAMREVHNHGIKLNDKGLETAQEFSWTNTASKLIHVLESL